MNGCNKKRGSLACEECDNWIVIKTLKSQRYPLGFVVERCRLDAEAEEE